MFRQISRTPKDPTPVSRTLFSPQSVHHAWQRPRPRQPRVPDRRRCRHRRDHRKSLPLSLFPFFSPLLFLFFLFSFSHFLFLFLSPSLSLPLSFLLPRALGPLPLCSRAPPGLPCPAPPRARALGRSSCSAHQPERRAAPPPRSLPHIPSSPLQAPARTARRPRPPRHDRLAAPVRAAPRRWSRSSRSHAAVPSEPRTLTPRRRPSLTRYSGNDPRTAPLATRRRVPSRSPAPPAPLHRLGRL